MNKFQKLSQAYRAVLASFAGVLLLAGCDDVLTAAPTSAPDLGENTVETVQVDVVAPEAFSITDTALWDGRPTFGGVWIAYPDIEDPERVRIRNDANGKEVIGALYKRERDFPGPKIELSADAATALGVLAGVPSELTIVALRRKTVEVEVPVEETGDPDMQTPLRRPSVGVPAASVPVPAPTPVAAPPEPDPIVPIPADASETSEIEQTTLPEAGGNAEGSGKFVQVATLQNKARAETLVGKLTTAGLDAEIRERESGNTTFYRIVVGPASSPEALEIMLKVLDELGYKDVIILG